jgi:putative PIN family toxin of toxin-antitoxin system
LVDEFLEVVKRPKFRRFFSSDDIEELLETIEEFADFVNIESQVEICRDSKDNFLLSLSIDGKADFLLNGDKDLLVLTKFGETSIITISEFLKEK